MSEEVPLSHHLNDSGEDPNFLPDGYSDTVQYVEDLLQFLHRYRILYNYYRYAVEGGDVVGEDNVIDFLRRDHWGGRMRDSLEGQLPETCGGWSEALLHSATHDLVHMVSDGEVPREWPSTLRDFVKRAHALRLLFRRQHVEEENGMQKEKKQHRINRRSADQHLRHVDYIMQQGMSAKKRYEVKIMTSLVQRVARDAECATVIDIGSGQGYLTQTIAFDQHARQLRQRIAVANGEEEEKERVAKKDVHNGKDPQLTIVGIDTDKLQTKGAEQRVQKLAKRVIRKQEHLGENVDNRENAQSRLRANVKSITSHLDLSISEHKFLKLLKPLLEKEVGNEHEMGVNAERMLMIGLHTCGDLAATMLRLFVQSDAAALINVGCCYHRLTERYDAKSKGKREQSNGESNMVTLGYPMSQYMSKHGIDISAGGKCLACLAVARWQRDMDCDSLKQSRQQFLNASFRCALQVVLHEMFGIYGDQTAVIGRVPKQHSRTFGMYVQFSLRKMLGKLTITADNNTLPIAFSTNYTREQLSNLKQRISSYLESKQPAILQQELDELYEKRFQAPPAEPIKHVEVWWSLRSLMGPVIEALILIDRLFFLREHDNVRAHLVRAFDPEQSPRGLIVIANKSRAEPCEIKKRLSPVNI